MTGPEITLADLSAALRAARVLVAEFGHLPAPDVTVSTIYPDRLELVFHDGFAPFEAWRDALDIPHGDVVHRVQSNGRMASLDVHGEFAGARLRLTGFAPVAAPEPGAEAAS